MGLLTHYMAISQTTALRDEASSLRFVSSSFGWTFLLCWFSLCFPFLPYGEPRDLFFYGLVAVGLPAILTFSRLRDLRFAQRAPTFFLGLGAAINAGLFIAQWGVNRSWMQVVPAGILIAVLDLALTYAIAKFLFEKSGAEQGLILFATLTLCLPLIGDRERFLPWLNWPQWTTYVLGPFLFWGTSKIFFGEPVPRARAITKWVVDLFWYSVFFFTAVLPKLASREIDLHHLSFYLGPIHLIKQGGLPLYDVPSQYGFLSVLLPAWLPWPTERAFGLLFGLLLFVNAAVTYLVLKSYPLARLTRLWAGIMAFLLVFFLPGDPEGLAVFARPSSGAYRFLWCYLLSLLLFYQFQQKQNKRATLAQAVCFTVGCLWSFESAIYCAIILGVTVVATLADKKRHKESVMPILWGHGSALGLLGVSLVGIELFYRFYLGLVPDWFNFIEFALSYSAGFGSIPMQPWGVVNSLVVFLALTLSFVVWYWLNDGEEKTALFVLWALILGPLSYFISRTYPQNLVNLTSLWFPAFCLVAATAQRETNRLWSGLFKSAVFLLTVTVALNTLVPVPFVNLKRSVSFTERKATNPLLFPSREIPISSWAENVAVNETISANRTDWLPISPPEMFSILAPKRQAIYLARFLKRRAAPKAVLLRMAREATEEEKLWESEILKRYVKTSVESNGPTSVIEAYQLR